MRWPQGGLGIGQTGGEPVFSQDVNRNFSDQISTWDLGYELSLTANTLTPCCFHNWDQEQPLGVRVEL